MPEYLETTVDKFTFRVATDRLYTSDGVWVQPQGTTQVRVGLTDFVQQHGGDVAFAKVKPTGTSLEPGDELAELETMKVNVELPSPVTGTIVEINKALELKPELINQDPFGKGWLAVVEPRTGKPIARSCSIQRRTSRRCSRRQSRSSSHE